MNDQQPNSRREPSAIARALTKGWRVWCDDDDEEEDEAYLALLCAEDAEAWTGGCEQPGHRCDTCERHYTEDGSNCLCDYQEDDDGNLSLREDDGHGLHG